MPFKVKVTVKIALIRGKSIIFIFFFNQLIFELHFPNCAESENYMLASSSRTLRIMAHIIQCQGHIKSHPSCCFFSILKGFQVGQADLDLNNTPFNLQK